MNDTNLLNRTKIRSDGMKKDEEGVATTVGTIMALLVFLSLLSLITQQYVPVWMEDKEAYHMDQVMGQMADIKSTIDNQVMNEYRDYPMYNSVTLGSEGIPLFASQTAGIMDLSPGKSSMNLNFSDFSGFSSSGNLSVIVPNRYYEQQNVIYENGAIILQQEDDSIIRAPPHLVIEESGGSYSVETTMVDMQGDSMRKADTGNLGVVSELWSSNKKTFTSPEDLNITIRSSFVSAWESWLVNNTDADDDLISVNGNELTIEFPDENVSDLTVTYSNVHMRISQ